MKCRVWAVDNFSMHVGLMSWMDLGLELVAQFLTPAVMRQLGKFLIIDTAPREQRSVLGISQSFKQFISLRFDHGDDVIHKIQTHIQAKFHARPSAEHQG